MFLVKTLSAILASFGGNYVGIFLGFILQPLIAAFGIYKIFSLLTNIRIPWWFWILTSFFYLFVPASLVLIILATFIIALLIYFIVAKRHISFTYIASNFTFVMAIYEFTTGILGPTVTAIYGAFSPSTVIAFNNYGADVIIIIELLLTYLFVKKFKDSFDRYSTMIIRQRPLLAWLFNLYLLSFNIFRFGFHSQFLHINTFTFVCIGILYYLLTIAFVKIAANYFYYRGLALSQATELTNLQTYTSHIEEMYDDLRRFRHDYKNLLLSLNDAVHDGTIEEVRQIFDHVVLPTNSNVEIRTAVLGHLANIKDLEIKSLVYSKVMAAMDKQIDVTIEVVEPITLVKAINITDALRMISILFDNAINAAAQSAEKKISFSYFNKDSEQLIVIGNSTKDERVDLNQLNGHFTGLTTSRHSLGLRNLRMILNKYPLIAHNTKSANHWLEQVLIIHH